METTWLDKLQADQIVLIDGGTGSELQRRGVSMSRDAWSGVAAYTHKNLLREIHETYIRAGAEVITTNTFGTTRFVLESAGLGDEFSTINRRAVEAATEAREVAAQHPVAIAGAISWLPPRLDIAAYPDAQKERDAYRELAHCLAEEGVDLIALEMMDLNPAISHLDDEETQEALFEASYELTKQLEIIKKRVIKLERRGDVGAESSSEL